MAAIPNFARMMADDLLEIIPATETTEWEFKSAEVFDRARFGEFKKQKLGSIVSSFANSGGGNLLLGKDDGTKVFRPVPTHEGRTVMEDHLSLVISQSVVPHYRNFGIHRVPISGKSGESVLVVAFDDSPAAPHQSVADTNYLYRLPGHCVPAPHFHLELLRSRYTRAVLEIGSIVGSITIPFYHGNREEGNKVALCVKVTVEIRNASQQIADPCGMRVFCDGPNPTWVIQGTSKPLHEGCVMQCDPRHLFPSLGAVMTIDLRAYLPKESPAKIEHFLDALASLEICVQPLSQNFVGEARQIQPALLFDEGSLSKALDTYNREVTQFGKNIKDTLEQARARLPDLGDILRQRPW